jgi:hypothetical protein
MIVDIGATILASLLVLSNFLIAALPLRAVAHGRSNDRDVSPGMVKGRPMLRLAQHVASVVSCRPARWRAPTAGFLKVAPWATGPGRSPVSDRTGSGTLFAGGVAVVESFPFLSPADSLMVGARRAPAPMATDAVAGLSDGPTERRAKPLTKDRYAAAAI